MHLAMQHSSATAARHYQIQRMLTAQEQATAFQKALHGDFPALFPGIPPMRDTPTPVPVVMAHKRKRTEWYFLRLCNMYIFFTTKLIPIQV
jgi:hypothetical protein